VFSIGLPNAGYAASLFRAVAAVVEEATFRVTGDSMGLVSMDPSHVSLVDFELQKWAGEFRADGETRMTIDLRELLRFLRRAGRGESITLEYDEGERMLSILLEDPAGSRARRYQLKTLEWESEPITMPSLSFTALVTISSDALWDAVEDAGLVADYLDIAIRPDAVIFSAKGDLGAAEDRLSIGSPMVHGIEADEEASARYSRSYLEKIVGSARELSDAVTIELSPNMPLRLTFSILGGKLLYLIAPRVE